MLKNDLDFAKLQAYTYTIGLVWKETYNLQEWIERVLDEPEIEQINNILKSKRINYIF